MDLQQADREKESRRRVEELIAHFAKMKDGQDNSEKIVPASLPASLGALERQKSSFWTVYPVLLKRSYLNFRRSPSLVLTRIMQVSSFGIILALFYSRLGNDYVAVQNRVGYIQEITPLVFVGMLVVAPLVKQVFDLSRTISLFIRMRGTPFIGSMTIGHITLSRSFWHISPLKSRSNLSWELFVLYF